MIILGDTVRFSRGLIIIAVIGGVALSGCSASVGGGSVDRADLEQEVSQRLEEQVGTAPKQVECSEGLPAEVGAETRCTVTAPDDSQIGATVTVTEVEGNNVSFDIQVDQE